METFFPDLLRALLIPVIILGYVALFNWALNRWTKFDDWRELFHKNNFAILLQRLGLLAAQPIAMMAVVPDFDTANPLWSSIWLLLEGLWVFVALSLAYVFVDWVLFPKIKNTTMLLQGNLAIGIVEAGFFVGIGILLNGSLTGTARSSWESFGSTVVFYVLGLAFVLLVYRLHTWVTLGRYNLHDRLKQGSTPAAIELAGVLVSASIVTRVGVAGDLVNWPAAFGWFAVTAIVSIVLLYVVRWLSDRLILRGHSVKEVQRADSSPAAIFQAAINILAALVVAAAMNAV